MTILALSCAVKIRLCVMSLLRSLMRPQTLLPKMTLTWLLEAYTGRRLLVTLTTVSWCTLTVILLFIYVFELLGLWRATTLSTGETSVEACLGGFRILVTLYIVWMSVCNWGVIGGFMLCLE